MKPVSKAKASWQKSHDESVPELIDVHNNKN